MRGSILQVDPRDQCGVVQGEDGRVRSFTRDAMVRWVQFLELKPGDVVSYEVEDNGSVINVERIGPPPKPPSVI